MPEPNLDPVASDADEHEHLMRLGKTIVGALGQMFAPACEVVLHDLRRPTHAIAAIENPISGRKVGDPTTEMGLARIADRGFPDVQQNYANRFPNGRRAKSTSIGLRDSSGQCVAAICLNMDVDLLTSAIRVLEQMTVTLGPPGVAESLRPRSVLEVSDMLEAYAASYGAQPRGLDAAQREGAVRTLVTTGVIRLRGAPRAAAQSLGISRATFYNLLKRVTAPAAAG